MLNNEKIALGIWCTYFQKVKLGQGQPKLAKIDPSSVVAQFSVAGKVI